MQVKLQLPYFAAFCSIQLTHTSTMQHALCTLHFALCNLHFARRRFSWTSAQCPHVGAFRSSFYIFFIFWAEVPPLLNGGILKRLPNTLENTNVFAGNNVKAWEQTYLPINAHSAVTSTSLNKSNGKRLCRKISLLRNKCDAMIAKSYGAI